MTTFVQNMCSVDERYEVGLSWKDNAQELQSNYKSAELRLHFLSRKLNKDSELKTWYNEVLQERR